MQSEWKIYRERRLKTIITFSLLTLYDAPSFSHARLFFSCLSSTSSVVSTTVLQRPDCTNRTCLNGHAATLLTEPSGVLRELQIIRTQHCFYYNTPDAILDPMSWPYAVFDNQCNFPVYFSSLLVTTFYCSLLYWLSFFFLKF